MNKLLVLLTILVFTACTGNEQKDGVSLADTSAIAARDTQQTAPGDTADKDLGRFVIYYEQMINAVLQNDAATFNRFIHPEYGLCIIESAGAMPQMRNGKDISRFRTIQGKALFELDKESFICSLEEEELPKIDCDKKGFYTKEGCFTQAINTFKDEKIWEYSNLKESEEAIAARSAGTITRTVINTKGYRFYFSRIGNQWFLTFLDLRVPCNA